MAYIEEVKRNGSTVEHELTAPTLDDIIAGVKKAIADYHPLGYGTAVMRIVYVASPRGYEWNAVVRRAASCD